MNREDVLLFWKMFQPNFSSILTEFYIDSTFTDVSLVCDDQDPIRAHKAVLSACSPILKNLLLENPDSHTLLLTGVRGQELQTVLQFMYIGDTNIDRGIINKVLSLAKELGIKQFVDDKIVVNDFKHVATNTFNQN